MSAGYSGTRLPKKLGIKEGALVAVLGAPEHFSSLLGPLPRGVRLRSELRGSAPHDVLIAFVTAEAELRMCFDQAHRPARDMRR